MPGFNMDDYVPVNERIDAFKAQFADGSLQSEIVELTDSRVTVKAYAYRTPDDPRPGVGHSSLDIPGATPYTKGSEIENCETSAWGRAIAALGFEVKRGVSSREEVRNKQSEQGVRAAPSKDRAAAKSSAVPAPTTYRRGELHDLMVEKGLDPAGLESYAYVLGIPKDERPLTNESMDRLIAAVQGHGTDAELVIESGGPSPEPEAVPAAPPAETAGAIPPVPAVSPRKGRTTEEAIEDAKRKAAEKAEPEQEALSL